MILSLREWDDWVDLAAIGNNLVAGVICGLAILYVTYKIINETIKRREAARWQPARQSLIEMLRRTCGTVMGGWAVRSGGHKYSASDIFDDQKLADDIRIEVIQLSSVSPEHLVGLRRREYWLDQLDRFCDLQPVVRLAIDRIQVTLPAEPKLVESILEFEKFFTAAPFVRHAYSLVGDRPNPTGVPAIFSVAESVRKTLLVLIKLRDKVEIAANGK